jgi:hypothetical protein
MILDIDPEVAQQLQAAQTTYHQNRVIGTGDYEALIRKMFDEFEQTEREQGFAFLSHPRPITPATRSEYIEPLRRIQGEAPLTGDALTALVSSFPDSELEAMSADPNRQRPAPSAPDRKATRSRVAQTKATGSKTPRRDAGGDRRPRNQQAPQSAAGRTKGPVAVVAAKPVRATHAPTGAVTDSVYEAPVTISEFLRAHPGATFEDTIRYFPRAAVEKQIRVGNIVSRQGRLYL